MQLTQVRIDCLHRLPRLDQAFHPLDQLILQPLSCSGLCEAVIIAPIQA